jgi:hypothetical protein
VRTTVPEKFQDLYLAAALGLLRWIDQTLILAGYDLGGSDTGGKAQCQDRCKNHQAGKESHHVSRKSAG